MRCNLVLLFTIVSFVAFSQAPTQINYQGLLWNSSGVPITNRTIGLRFQLHQGSLGGPVVFTEIQNGPGSGNLGLINTRGVLIDPGGWDGKLIIQEQF